jgi:hypothetical protein
MINYDKDNGFFFKSYFLDWESFNASYFYIPYLMMVYFSSFLF